MRFSVILGLCVVACGALVANGDSISAYAPGTFGFDVTAHVSRTINISASGYDRVDIMLDAMAGPAVGYGINVMEGTWTAPAGSSFELGSDTSVAGWNSDNGPPDLIWGNWACNLPPSPPLTGYGTPPQSNAALSFVNFGSIVSGATIWGRTPDGGPEHFTSFAGSWYTTATNAYWQPGLVTRMARLFIPTGTWNPLNGVLTYTGKLSFSFNGGSVEAGQLAFGDVPEPGTVALLASGLIGLAVYAWRRRK